MRDVLRLFDAFAGDGAAAEAADAGVAPSLNVTQDERALYVRALLPGVVAEDLAVTAERGRLTISGRRVLAQKVEERGGYHRREREGGAFSRAIALPQPFDAERVEARFADGVLTVTLPKADEARPRRVVVKGGA